jgi:hypothetical protein
MLFPAAIGNVGTPRLNHSTAPTICAESIPLCRSLGLPGSTQTRRLIDSPFVPLLFAVPYALLAFQAWQGGALAAVEAAVRASAPLPDAAAIGAVFREPVLTAMAWLHLLLLDLLQAR